MADPASIVDIPRSSSFCAIRSFSSVESATPGVCSPSLSVVSRKRIFWNNIIPHIFFIDIECTISDTTILDICNDTYRWIHHAIIALIVDCSDTSFLVLFISRTVYFPIYMIHCCKFKGKCQYFQLLLLQVPHMS